MGREGIPRTIPRTIAARLLHRANVGELRLSIACHCKWLSVPVCPLSSILAEGVDLGARPHYCKPEEFLSKVIFCSSTSGHSAL